MGLLALGTPLQWADSLKYLDIVRTKGIEQFIYVYNLTKDKERDALLWGDEIEYIVVQYEDQPEKKASVSLCQSEVLAKLQKEADPNRPILFHAEYGRYMLEATPLYPFTSDFVDLLKVEDNMKLRRLVALEKLTENQYPLTLTSFPRLGCPSFTSPPYVADGPASRSFFLPDQIINPHVRFPTLTANIRSRRGQKVDIQIPIFKDINTPKPFIDFVPQRNIYPEDSIIPRKEDTIYMESMGFGMGCCCLQITFQAKNINEARLMYDLLAPFGPIMMAVSAASPFFKGLVSDQDCRWNVISKAVDDRTDEERGLKPLQTSKYKIPKSRYDTIDCYIANEQICPYYKESYNDLPLVKDEAIKEKLMENGIDEQLSNHISHLFIRDPLVIFEEDLKPENDNHSSHFENIQSTNWQSLRFKPPPPGSNIGWRVEFRTMEVQLSDFENAAYSIFIVLLTRTILSFTPDFYIPMSKNDENMEIAHRRDAVNKDKFWFRNSYSYDDTSYSQRSIDSIINGDENCVGIMSLIDRYLDSINVDVRTKCILARYLRLIKDRASGKLPTAAAMFREFVNNHKDYKHDSVINDSVNYDLCKLAELIAQEEYNSAAGKAFLGGE